MSYANSAADHQTLPKVPRHKTGTKRHKARGIEAQFVRTKKRETKQRCEISLRPSVVGSDSTVLTLLQELAE